MFFHYFDYLLIDIFLSENSYILDDIVIKVDEVVKVEKSSKLIKLPNCKMMMYKIKVDKIFKVKWLSKLEYYQSWEIIQVDKVVKVGID